ncbi:MAG: tRNA adenosine(34) deaminase TadA [Terriglobales bacterium]
MPQCLRGAGPGTGAGRSGMNPQDQHWMQEALKLARAAELAGEVPVGAVVVSPEGDVLGRGYNRTLLDVDPSAHAELVALREAAWRMGNHRLPGCALYVTIEPCVMCAGALVQARIARLIYGAEEPRAGALRSVPSLAQHPALNHRFEVTAGVLAAECGALVRQFFQRRRGGNAPA